MTQTIIPIVPFCTNDFAQAEKLLDLLACYNKKQPKGYILIAASPDTHGEMHKRMQIAAKVGFEHVGLLTVGWPKEPPKTKGGGINWLFKETYESYSARYRMPFVWLEPDAVPTNSEWLTKLGEEYAAQPKFHMGAILEKGSERRMDKVAVYPPTYQQIVHKALSGETPFHVTAGNAISASAGKSKLFQVLEIQTEDDLAKVRDDAVVVHGDKSGILLQKKLEEWSKEPGKQRAGRPPKQPTPATPVQ